jgi:hypothetical protein
MSKKHHHDEEGAEYAYFHLDYVYFYLRMPPSPWHPSCDTKTYKNIPSYTKLSDSNVSIYYVAISVSG